MIKQLMGDCRTVNTKTQSVFNKLGFCHSLAYTHASPHAMVCAREQKCATVCENRQENDKNHKFTSLLSLQIICIRVDSMSDSIHDDLQSIHHIRGQGYSFRQYVIV